LHIPQRFAAGTVRVANGLAIEVLIRSVRTSVNGLARCSAEDARHAGIIAEMRRLYRLVRLARYPTARGHRHQATSLSFGNARVPLSD